MAADTLLTRAYSMISQGHVDYEAMVMSLTGVGTVKLDGLAAFGMKAYACIWSIIDACFPELAAPGGRAEQEINDQVTCASSGPGFGGKISY